MKKTLFIFILFIIIFSCKLEMESNKINKQITDESIDKIKKETIIQGELVKVRDDVFYTEFIYFEYKGYKFIYPLSGDSRNIIQIKE